MMFESMKSKVENVVERGVVSDEYITTDEERLIFDKWTDGFTRHDHPAVIQVLLENGKDKDITDHSMPNLIYLSREKRGTSHHHFKAGALNALVSEPYWFFVYVFLCLGGYGQDLIDFILEGSTVSRWWNDQRIWIIRGLSSYLFGLIESLSRHIASSTLSFNVTSKAVDDEQRKRYDQGIFEFGVASPIFVPIVMAAMINFAAFAHGLVQVLRWRDVEGLVMQMFLSGFLMLNFWPIYEAMVLRSDEGKMHTRVTAIAAIMAFTLYASTLLIFKE